MHLRICGFGAEATDGRIGKVDYVGKNGNVGPYLVVDLGPWIFGRHVVLPAGAVSLIDLAREVVFVDRTRQEIKDAPESGALIQPPETDYLDLRKALRQQPVQNGHMDADVQRYLDAIPPEHRPLFDRVDRLILRVHPEAELMLSYGMPTYRAGARKLYVGVWQHGISLYGWDKQRAARFTRRHPTLLSGKGTIRLRSKDADDVSDEDLGDLVHAALDT